MNEASKKMSHFIRQFPLFKDLTDYEIEPLIQFMEPKTYDINSFVFMEDEPMSHVYFILKGEVKIFRTDMEGNEQIVNLLKAPEMFPHQGLFQKGKYPANAQINKKAKLMSISISDFEEYLIVYPTVSIKMFRILSEIIADLQNRLKEKILLTVYEQIVRLLIRLVDRYGEKVNDEEYKIVLHFTNQDLANMIGSSRETVSRTLSLLRKEKLLRDDENNFFIVHYDQLKKESSL